jgi:hypothetical protein
VKQNIDGDANPIQSVTIRHRRMLAIEKILADECLAGKSKLADDPTILEECIEAMRRLKGFIAKREVTSDIESRLPSQNGNHLASLDIERYRLKMPMDFQEKAAVEEHLMWCQACFGELESAESLESMLTQRPA